MTREQKYPDTSTFHFHNQNPKGKYTEDCVFRAISLATGKPYNECVMEAAALMCETGYHLTGTKGEEAYLSKLGWRKHSQMRKADGTKYTGKQFCRIFKGVCVAHLGGGHTVCIKDGKVWDTWDSTDGCVGNYWTKE